MKKMIMAGLACIVGMAAAFSAIAAPALHDFEITFIHSDITGTADVVHLDVAPDTVTAVPDGYKVLASMDVTVNATWDGNGFVAVAARELMADHMSGDQHSAAVAFHQII